MTAETILKVIEHTYDRFNSFPNKDERENGQLEGMKIIYDNIVEELNKEKQDSKIGTLICKIALLEDRINGLSNELEIIRGKL